jgi:hypothetical protein
MAWRKKSLDFVGQIRGIIITHCCDLNSQGIAAECCNSTNFRSGVVPFATKAHVQPTSEGLRGILFSRSVCHQVLHSLQSDLQSGIRSRIFPVVGFEGFPAACKPFSVLSKRGFSNGTLLGTTQKVQWVGGTAGLKKNWSQLSHFILPVCGKRNCNFATATEKFKRSTTTTQKAKETVSKAKVGANLAEVQSNELLSGILKPVNSAMQTVMGLRQALGLHLEAFWKRNYLVVVGAVAIVSCLLLWRIMFGIASLFVSLSEGMAKFGFLALAAGMVAIGGVVTRARYMVNPDTVYRIAMRKLNTSAAVLEVMGAPLTGTDVRAYVMSGGGLCIKNFRPRLSSKHCFLIFPITGGERCGLVSIEVKKKKGQYDFKLLAVDIPTAGAEHRVYVIGDEAEYRVGGGLISVLRDPIVKAMAAQKEFEERDEREDEEYRQWEAEETHTQDMLEKLEQDRASEVAAKEELTNPQVITRETEAAKA